jgi:hypothetical protein
MIARNFFGFIIYLMVMVVIAVMMAAVGLIYLLLIPFVGLPHHRIMQLKSFLRQVPSLPARYRV